MHLLIMLLRESGRHLARAEKVLKFSVRWMNGREFSGWGSTLTANGSIANREIEANHTICTECWSAGYKKGVCSWL